MNIVTHEFLCQEPKACDGEIKLFAEMFPQGAEVSIETISTARSAKLSLDWFAEKKLSAPAYAEYKKVRDAAYAEYEKVRDAALVAAILSM